jgi:hemerythrin superfamily protein
MNATKLLKSQHREVEQLFAVIEKANREEDKHALVLELADALAAHSAIEEQVFYPSVMDDDTEEQLREAVQEHLAVKRALMDLMGTRAGDERFDAMLKTLKELVDHHVDEEEGELFPKVNKTYDPADLEKMGEKLEALFAELLEGTPRHAIGSEIDEAAHLPAP